MSIYNITANLLSLHEYDNESYSWAMPVALGTCVLVPLFYRALNNYLHPPLTTNFSLSQTIPLNPRISAVREKLLKKGFQFNPNFCGKSHIYTNPEDLLHIVKHPGSEYNWAPQKRLKPMHIAQNLIAQNQLTHLIVPKAYEEDEWLVEERLPIKGVSSKEQISIYLNNLKQFEPVACEVTRFLCLSNFTDLLQGYGAKELVFANAPIPRYDNLPLYIENNEAKIGLIDLEHYALVSEVNPQHIYHSCEIATRFFPHHLDSILSAAKEYTSNSEEFRLDLEVVQKSALTFIDNIYTCHKNLLDKKKISLENYKERLGIAPDKHQEIGSDLINKCPQEFLSSHCSEEALQHAFQDILAHIDQFLKKHQSAALETPPTCEGELLNMRTICIDIIRTLKNELAHVIKKHGAIQNQSDFNDWLIETVFPLLVEKNQIANYAERYYGLSSYLSF